LVFRIHFPSLSLVDLPFWGGGIKSFFIMGFLYFTGLLYSYPMVFFWEPHVQRLYSILRWAFISSLCWASISIWNSFFTWVYISISLEKGIGKIINREKKGRFLFSLFLLSWFYFVCLVSVFMSWFLTASISISIIYYLFWYFFLLSPSILFVLSFSLLMVSFRYSLFNGKL